MPRYENGPVAETASAHEDATAKDTSPDDTTPGRDLTPDHALDAFLRGIEAAPRRRSDRPLAHDGFTVWLMAQRHRDDWVGHLAQEVAYDSTWPRHATRLRELHDYLYDLYALDAPHAALDQAWSEWRGAVV